MLTVAQAKLVGPVQPAGNVLNPVVIDRFVAVLPSSVVNVTLNVALDPTTTLIGPIVDGVATILLFVVVGGGGGGGAEDPPPPHAAKIAGLATMTHRLNNFRVLIISLSAAITKWPIQFSDPH